VVVVSRRAPRSGILDGGPKIKKKLAIDAVEVEAVRLIFRLYLEGDGARRPLCVPLPWHGMTSRQTVVGNLNI